MWKDKVQVSKWKRLILWLDDGDRFLDQPLGCRWENILLLQDVWNINFNPLHTFFSAWLLLWPLVAKQSLLMLLLLLINNYEQFLPSCKRSHLLFNVQYFSDSPTKIWHSDKLMWAKVDENYDKVELVGAIETKRPPPLPTNWPDRGEERQTLEKSFWVLIFGNNDNPGGTLVSEWSHPLPRQPLHAVIDVWQVYGMD